MRKKFYPCRHQLSAMRSHVIILTVILILFVYPVHGEQNLIFDNVLPGGYAESTIAVSTKGGIVTDISVVGEIKEWIHISKEKFDNGMLHLKLVVKPSQAALLGLHETT